MARQEEGGTRPVERVAVEVAARVAVARGAGRAAGRAAVVLGVR